MERDVLKIVIDTFQNISTHTLTWSVTISDDVKIVNSNISTHTLTWSVTRKWKKIPISIWISTHTLTWSVTQQAVDKINAMFDFNSHAHVERDLRFSTLALYHANFNSHAHVERDT